MIFCTPSVTKYASVRCFPGLYHGARAKLKSRPHAPVALCRVGVAESRILVLGTLVQRPAEEPWSTFLEYDHRFQAEQPWTGARLLFPPFYLTASRFPTSSNFIVHRPPFTLHVKAGARALLVHMTSRCLSTYLPLRPLSSRFNHTP